MEQIGQTEQQSGKSWYDKSYKWLLILPIGFLIVCLFYIFSFYSVHGDIMQKDVSLTGGTSISVFDSHARPDKIKEALRVQFPDLTIRTIEDIRTSAQKGFSVESSASPEQLKAALEKELGYSLTQDNSSIEFSGSSLSSGFYSQFRLGMIVAFILMAIVVFAIFRTFVPSAAVVLAAFADIVMTLATVDFLGIRVSGAGIVAFLMLIGYSVDTDILLTSRLLKSYEGSVNERLWGAFKTGMTMTITAIAAVGVSLIIIYSFSETLRQIFGIIFIGLVFDIFNTWITNASMLKWYLEARK